MTNESELHSFPEAGGPYYLTVASTGEAGEVWYSSLGVYSKTGARHNNKTVWRRHDGTKTIYYSTGSQLYQPLILGSVQV